MILIKRIKSMITIMLNLASKRQHSNFVFSIIFSTKGCESLARSYQQTVNIIRKW